ncbi:MAG: hypothetical protein P1U70_05005 [Saprospiraceae bacterium]|jgi:sarcosine oxidase delta subunit|nr:hypothetical protein [Saprospiraceae bacterium]
MIDDVRQALESSFFHEMTLQDSIENPFAREPGYIYYRQNPKIDVTEEWKNLVL